MSQRSEAAAETPVVAPDRVRATVLAIIQGARASGWTVESLAVASGVKKDTIKGWLEGKEPSLSKALSIAVVIGERAVNSILALIGYGGATPLDEPDEMNPALITATALAHLSTIAAAAADGRIDHTEQPACQLAADHLIATVLPLSSAGQAA